MSWKENKMVGVVFAIIAIAAIGFAGYKLTSGEKKGEVLLKCEKCQGIFKQATATTTFPITCPKCGTKTLYPTLTFRCPKCHKEYILIDKGDGKVSQFQCPKCKVAVELVEGEEQTPPTKKKESSPTQPTKTKKKENSPTQPTKNPTKQNTSSNK